MHLLIPHLHIEIFTVYNERCRFLGEISEFLICVIWVLELRLQMMIVRPRLLRWLNLLLLLGLDRIYGFDRWWFQDLIEGMSSLGELLALNSSLRDVLTLRNQGTTNFRLCCLGILPIYCFVSFAILLLQRHVHLFSQEPLVMLVSYAARLICLCHAWCHSATHRLIWCSHAILSYYFWWPWM